MGGVVSSIFGGGKSKSSQTSTPKDLTPSEFKGLRGPIADALTGLIQSGGPDTASGPFAAQITGQEQQLLDSIQQQALGGSATMDAGNAFLQSLLTGQGGTNPIAQAGPIAGGPTAMGDMNPFLQAQIEAAQRPLIEQFNEQTLPGLRSQFALAGQQVGGATGSSPFQMAQARASSGLANALGDISTGLSAQDFAQRQQLVSQEAQQQRALELAQLQSQSQAFQQQQQQQLQAVSQATGIEQAQLENLMTGLQAQALPRLVEQLGIDQGLEEFRRRQNQLLELLTTGGAIASPTVASVTTSGSSGSQSSGGLGQAIGTGLSFLGGAGLFSSREFKEDIAPADDEKVAALTDEVPLYHYQYRKEMGIDGKFISPMVEEVPEELRGADGVTINGYNLVSSLIAANRVKQRKIDSLERRMERLEALIGGRVDG